MVKNLGRVGFSPTTVKFVPISAQFGDNIKYKSKSMPWYNSKPLLGILNELKPSFDIKEMKQKPFRMAYIGC